MSGYLFAYGAQITEDGEIVPRTLTVLPASCTPHEIAAAVFDKIAEDIHELKLDRAEGSMVVQMIESWQQWADLEVNDQAKTKALVLGITEWYAELMFGSPLMSAAVPIHWGTDPETPES